MRKIIALMLIFCIVIIFCACNNGNDIDNTNTETEPTQTEPTQTEPTQAPAKYEDKLIENIKLRDKIEQAHSVFGQPIDKHVFDDGDHMYTYADVSIFECKFTPTVFAYKGYNSNDYLIEKYEYEYPSGSIAKSSVVHRELIENFTALYGEPYISEDTATYYRWYFKDGSELLVFMSENYYPFTVYIKYSK